LSHQPQGMQKNWLQIEASGKKAVIKLEGKISPLAKTSELFDAEMTKLEKAGVTEAKIKINSVGGSVIEGIKMYNRVKASPMAVTKEVVQLAASMSAVLASGGEINKPAKMMFHKPFIPKLENASAADLREIAELLENYETEMIAMVAESTNLSAEEIRAKFFKEEDTWLTAEQAVEAGIMTGLVNTKTSYQLPQNWLELDAAASYDATQKGTNPQKNTMEGIEVEAVAKELGMTAGSTKEQVLAEIANVKDLKAKNELLKDKVAALEASVETEKKAKVVAFVEDVIAQGKAGEGERAQLLLDATASFEVVKRVFDKIPAKVDLSNIGKGSGAEGSASATSRKDWDYNAWCEKDPQGLTNMKKNDRPKYDALIDAYANS